MATLPGNQNIKTVYCTLPILVEDHLAIFVQSRLNEISEITERSRPKLYLHFVPSSRRALLRVFRMISCRGIHCTFRQNSNVCKCVNKLSNYVLKINLNISLVGVNLLKHVMMETYSIIEKRIFLNKKRNRKKCGFAIHFRAIFFNVNKNTSQLTHRQISRRNWALYCSNQCVVLAAISC